MELKVGMYVRTDDGNISKIKDINKFIYTDKQCYGQHYIKKASDNIIDLIEVGDYVNGEYVDLFSLDYYKNHSERIKSIVTKEQFDSMKYEVE